MISGGEVFVPFNKKNKGGERLVKNLRGASAISKELYLKLSVLNISILVFI